MTLPPEVLPFRYWPKARPEGASNQVEGGAQTPRPRNGRAARSARSGPLLGHQTRQIPTERLQITALGFQQAP